MNLSGRAVQTMAAFYKIEPQRLWVFHDDLDLAPCAVRVKCDGGHGGHNGVRSIEQALGTPDFWRVRLGIGHPGHKDRVADYVLHDFAKADQTWLDDLMAGISDGAAHLAGGDAPKFLNTVALRLAPPKEKKPAPARDIKPKATDAPADTRSPMEKLLDRFRP
jgi:PTH1 family peptidyl-tRNA hydrolase